MAYAYGRTSPRPGYAQPAGLYSPQQQPAAPPTGQIQPGSITYTTSAGQDGRVVYHPFRAVAASYDTPQGIVSGIQWVPAEATSVLPAGATPANQDFMASFGNSPESRNRDIDRRRRPQDRDRDVYDRDRDAGYRDDYGRRDRERDRGDRDRDYGRYDREDELTREDIRDELRDQIRRERTYGTGGAADRELERRMQELDFKDPEHDYDRRRERERERDREERERRRDRDREDRGVRRSSVYSGSPEITPATYPASSTPIYSPASTYAAAPYGAGAAGGYPATQRVARPVSPYQAGPVAPRPVSPYQVGAGIARAASPYGAPPTSPYAPVAPSASPYQGGVGPRPVSPYQPGAGIARAASPYGTNPGVYPPGHILEGKPIGGGRGGLSRAPSPSPIAYGGAPTAYGGAPTAYGGAPAAYGAAPVAQQQMLAAPEGFSRPPNLAQPYTEFKSIKVQDMDDFFESDVPRMPVVLTTHDVYHEDWIRFMQDLTLSWSGKLPVPEYAQDGRPLKRAVLTADLIDLWNMSFFLKRGVEVVLYKGREYRTGSRAGTVDVHFPGSEYEDSYRRKGRDADVERKYSLYVTYVPPSIM